MSSTTSRSAGESGQVLPLFVGGLITIILIAALVFDVGQSLLDRRTEQDTADAAALAGARYLTEPACQGAPSLANCADAVAAARQLATKSGYTDGVANATVTVKVPPGPESTFSGLPGYIEVSIGSTRPSLFAGVIGTITQRTAAMGVAANAAAFALPYSLLALDPTGCGTNFINGNGAAVSTNGTVHVDSNCPSGAVALSGTGVLTSPECDVVGIISTSGGAHDKCTSAPTGIQVSGDPLRELPPPAQPGTPAAVHVISGSAIPPGCPGNSPVTDAAPGGGCVFNSAGNVWRIFPGNYPGGITVQKGTVYMDPGIYWIGGGGIQINGPGSTSNTAVLVSKAAGDNTGYAPTGGVLIYNTQDPDPTIAAACAANPAANGGCFGSIWLNGGASTLGLVPYQSAPYQNMVIFFDRAAPLSAFINLNGGSSNLSVSGTIYAPHTIVQMRGGASDTISAQLIVWNFQLNGNGSSLTVNYNAAGLFQLSGTGLVQ